MGPLAGIRVVEVAALGAVPFAAMMLADAGADVLRIDRITTVSGRPTLIERGRDLNAVGRSRRSIAVDLKQPSGVELVLDLVERADILLEGFRPQVVERLGIGPDVCLGRNPRLVYGRLTGWGRTGPLADRAGHDINYLALSGTLSAIGPADRPPPPPLNLVADFGGGGSMLAFGVVSALTRVHRDGRGGVVDAAMVDGAASLATYIHSMRAAGTWVDARQSNVLDGGAPFYGTYTAADGGFMAVGAVEPAFYRQLIAGLGFEPADLPDQLDRTRWPAVRAMFERRFATRTRREWEDIFSGTDACVTPVLTMEEASRHPHLRHRGTFIVVDGVTQPAPVARFGLHDERVPSPPVAAGAGGGAALRDWGYDLDLLGPLVEAGVVHVDGLPSSDGV